MFAKDRPRQSYGVAKWKQMFMYVWVRMREEYFGVTAFTFLRMKGLQEDKHGDDFGAIFNMQPFDVM